MISWLGEHLGTLVITLLLIAIVSGIIMNLRKSRKKGSCACCSQCSTCSLCNACGKNRNP